MAHYLYTSGRVLSRSTEDANATPTDTNPAELGTIIVKIKRVEIVGKHQANTPLEPRPPVAGRHSFGEPPVGIGCVAYNARRA